MCRRLTPYAHLITMQRVTLAAAPVYRGTAHQSGVRSRPRFAAKLAILAAARVTRPLASAVTLLVTAFGASVYAAQPSDLQTAAQPAGPLFKLDEYRGGKALSLGEQRGKIVLLHFFATYCEPCRPEMASLDRFLKANAGKPFSVFAVDVGEIDLKVRAFFEKQPVSFPIVMDRDRKVSKAWGIYALPTTIVLNENLEPKLIVEGDLDWNHPDVLKKLEELLPRAEPSQSTRQLRKETMGGEKNG